MSERAAVEPRRRNTGSCLPARPSILLVLNRWMNPKSRQSRIILSRQPKRELPSKRSDFGNGLKGPVGECPPALFSASFGNLLGAGQPVRLAVASNLFDSWG